jgi:hypothetical protein
MRPRKSEKFSFNWGAFAAIFISCCALIVSIYQSVIFRNQQFATVWPYIEPNVQYSNHNFELVIQNKGTGPAIIKTIDLSLDGQPVKDYQQFIKDLLHQQAFNSMSINAPNNSVLSAGEKVLFLTASLPDSLLIARTDFNERVSLSVCYCSIFGDCWEYVDGEVTGCDDCKKEKK